MDSIFNLTSNVQINSVLIKKKLPAIIVTTKEMSF